ncbi:MAG: GNAT family N-acetyltransferase [Proteobacteria bacterium]|nr:GNAT family N-acetyltransferase [Pseudomonadota bacterium]
MRLRLADHEADRAALAALWLEYLGWANDALEAACGLRLGDAATTVAADLAHLEAYAPPLGALLLAQDDAGALVGCAALRASAPGAGEFKRFYVRPAARGQGVGAALVQALLARAQQAGYRTVRLDSARFMTAAHAMYRAHGFEPTAPYAESEIPPAYQPHWVFMQRPLTTFEE